MTLKLEPVLTPAEKQRRERWKLFLFFGIISPLAIWELHKSPMPPETWRGWAILLGAMFFLVAAPVTLLSLIFGWSEERADRVAVKLLGWIFGAPALLALALILGWGLIAGLGAPPWALVVTALLALIAWRLWRPARRY